MLDGLLKSCPACVINDVAVVRLFFSIYQCAVGVLIIHATTFEIPDYSKQSEITPMDPLNLELQTFFKKIEI
jgi:hypothetical protein